MKNTDVQNTDQKLDTLIELIRHLLAIELARSGVSRSEIAKRLHVATATVVEMLRGVEKGTEVNERKAA